MSPAQDPATGETGYSASRARHAPSLSGTITTRPRRTTVQSDIQETIQHPGNVRINVQGAFIVDEEQPGTPQSEDYEHDPKDIRLPNHTAVVSHIAVDVSFLGVACSLLRGTRQPPLRHPGALRLRREQR
jgi:type II pantothenate kinase